jgi:hypothetical protein
MAEEVQVDWVLGFPADDFEFGPDLTGSQHGTGERAESASLGDGDDHGGIHRAGHGGLDDGELDFQEV